MDQHLADILPYATAVALSPMPIAALILVLLSKRAMVNSIFYSIGWIAGLAVLVFLVKYLIALLAGGVHVATGFSISDVIHLVFGLLLIFLAIREWQARPKKGKLPQMPKWMKAIEKTTPQAAFMIGFLLATLNLKNTPMGITVGAVISNAGSYQTTVFIAYLLIASATITIPTIAFLFMGKKLQRPLQSLKAWLVDNNATIMFVLFLVLGVFLISKAFGN